MNFVQKTIVSLVLMSGVCCSNVFAMADISDEQEVTYAQTIVDNKEAVVVAAVATVIAGYLGYKYGDSVIDFVKSLFVRNDNADAVNKITENLKMGAKNVAQKATSYYSNTYAQ